MSRAMDFWRRHWRGVVALVVLAVAMAGGVAVRRHVYEAQRALAPGGEVPFTLESALAYRRVALAYRDGAAAEHDAGVGYPQGIETRKTDTTGEERVIAAAARAWPGWMPLAEKVRWLEVLWFAVAGLAGMFCLVAWAGGGMGGGAVAAAFWAVAVSAVARSTGQELLHENHAFPLILWGLACLARGMRGGRGAWGAAGAVLLAGALCLWDLTQYALGLVWLGWAVQALAGRTERRTWAWGILPLAVATAAAGAANPYLRAHGFVTGGTMALGWGVLAAGSPWAQRRGWGWRAAALAVPAGAALAAGWAAAGVAYGHFAGLLWAKVRFGNVKPLDPAVLTFDQRILWTPALNSATWGMVPEWFPGLAWAGLAAWGAAVWAWWKEKDRAAGFGALALAVSGAAFALFFRFHAWVAVFACALTGWAAGRLWGRWRTWGRLGLAVALAAAWGVELSQPLLKPLRWGRPFTYPGELAELAVHLRKHVAPEPVAANFGVSGSIAAYGGCPVALHPKFESAEIRREVEGYERALFCGTEEDFRDWMEAHRVGVYVHSMGELAEVKPELRALQMRYMVDALEPPQDAAVRLFEQRPEELKHFVAEFANIKYRVFRLKDGSAGAARAERLAGKAREALESGALETALRRSRHALRIDPDNESAQKTVQHAASLLEAGIDSTEADAECAEDGEFPMDPEGMAPALAPTEVAW